MKCFVCGGEAAEVTPKAGDWIVIDCRECGIYGIAETVLVDEPQDRTPQDWLDALYHAPPRREVDYPIIFPEDFRKS